MEFQKVLKLFCSSFLAVGSFTILACSSAPKEAPDLSLPDKEPPRFNINVVKNELRNGLHSLKDRSTTAFVFYSKPDAYLIRGQKQMPEGQALLEVKERQEDRKAMLQEALVESCDECEKIVVQSPIEVLSEATMLSLFDKAALGIEPTPLDWENLAKESSQNDLLFVLLGKDEIDQNRVIAEQKDVIKSTSEAIVNLKVLLYDVRKAKTLVVLNADGIEGESLLYARVSDLSSSPGSLLKRIKNSIVFGPSEELMDPKLDDIYPYPTPLGHSLILRKTISRVIENLSP